jgi:hypothetical protein
MAPKPGPFVCVERNGPLSFPKIRSGLGSPHEAETLHHPGRPDLISSRDKPYSRQGSKPDDGMNDNFERPVIVVKKNKQDGRSGI